MDEPISRKQIKIWHGSRTLEEGEWEEMNSSTVKSSWCQVDVKPVKEAIFYFNCSLSGLKQPYYLGIFAKIKSIFCDTYIIKNKYQLQHFINILGPVLMAARSKALPMNAICLSPLPGFEPRLGQGIRWWFTAISTSYNWLVKT